MKIKFEINSQEYVINEIRVNQYYEVKQELFMDAVDVKFNVISKLSGCPVETLRELDLEDWSTIWNHLERMIESVSERKLTKSFFHNGIEYGLVNLDEMTIGEFADLDVVLNTPDADNKLHEILAILYRPIVKNSKYGNEIEEYDFKGFKFRSQLFLDVPLFLAKPATAFFLHSGLAYLETIQSSLKNENLDPLTEKTIQLVKILLNSGGKPSTDSLEEMLSISKELQNLELEKRSISSSGNTKKVKKQKSKHKNSLKNITVEDDN